MTLYIFVLSCWEHIYWNGMCSWWSVPFIIKKCPCLSIFTLKSSPCDISTAPRTYLRMLFAWSIIFHFFPLSFYLGFYHLKAVCSWVLHFNPSFYSVLFDWWVQSAYMYGDYWYMRIYYSLFIFSGGSAFSLFLFPCVDIYYLSLVVFYKFFLFIFLNVTCLSYIIHFYFIDTSRFMWKILLLYIP